MREQVLFSVEMVDVKRLPSVGQDFSFFLSFCLTFIRFVLFRLKTRSSRTVNE